jgi:hypothetical protein
MASLGPCNCCANAARKGAIARKWLISPGFWGGRAEMSWRVRPFTTNTVSTQCRHSVGVGRRRSLISAQRAVSGFRAGLLEFNADAASQCKGVTQRLRALCTANASCHVKSERSPDDPQPGYGLDAVRSSATPIKKSVFTLVIL